MKKCTSFFIALTILLLSCLPFLNVHAAETPAAGKVSTNGYRLNVREKATTSSSVLTQLEDQSWITLLKEEGSWWYVRCGENTFGYCHKAYIQPRANSYHAVLSTGEDGNVFRRTETGFERKKTLPAGSAVTVLNSDGEWSCILFSGTRKGYVPNEKVRACRTLPTALNVPRYSQTDPRWKNVRIGKGGTIGSIGCTTTCLAMNETYLTGKTVTPSAMAKKLTYTPGGSLYWPSDYQVRLSDENALLLAAELLGNGRPVVFGAKKENGSQHWVVLTGCSGTGVSPSCFFINDPATASRKTLAQYLKVYPNFYKIAWR